MGARASSLSDQVTKNANGKPTGSYDQSKVDSGKLAETLQWVGYGVGAAAMVTGAALYWMGLPKAGETPLSPQARALVVPDVAANRVGGSLLVVF